MLVSSLVTRPNDQLSVSLVSSTLDVKTKVLVLVGLDGAKSSISELESLRVVGTLGPCSCNNSFSSLVVSVLNGEIEASVPSRSQGSLGSIQVPNLLVVALDWGIDDSSVLASSDVSLYSDNSSSGHL